MNARINTDTPTRYALAIGDAVTREIASPGGCRSPERRLAAWARAVAVLSDAECRALLDALVGGRRA